eukprot:4474856-Pleurochrysis_carterae.AAC.1
MQHVAYSLGVSPPAGGAEVWFSTLTAWWTAWSQYPMGADAATRVERARSRLECIARLAIPFSS